MNLLLFVSIFASAAAEGFLQPGWRDEVHAVWVNGPPHSAQLGGGWPKFGVGAGSSNSQCSLNDPSIRYTGYQSNGGFCEYASDALDQNPHLVMYSGNVGLVLDASAKNGNLFPKLGSTAEFVQDKDFKATDVYSDLAESSVTASLSINCPDVGTSILTASPLQVAEFGLVRQGHAVTQVIVEQLEWTTDAGELYAMDPLCDQEPVQYPSPFNCIYDYGVVERNGDTHRSCPDPGYPTCVGFVAGSRWGKCNSDPLIQGDQPCSSDYGVGGASVSNPCETTDFPTCTGSKCYADPVADPSNQNCNQHFEAGRSWPCKDPNHPTCLGFIQGSSWGKCHSVATNDESCDSDYGTEAGSCGTQDYPICNENNLCSKDPVSCFLEKPWLDITMWGDSIALHIHWDGSTADQCSGQVHFEVKMGSKVLQKKADFKSETKTGVLLMGDGGGLLQEQASPLADRTITSSSSGTQVLERPDFGDFIVEVPSSTPKCGYNHCGNILATVDVTAKNSNPSQIRTVRLSLSRNFFTGYGISGSRTGAEITGLNVMVWNKATHQPNGIPSHISKNWHSKGTSVYNGYWWTANLLFKLPPGGSVDLTFAIIYEKFKGIPAWSHAQLSIVGYSNKWLWEEAALGTGGENFVMDPMGCHTRAAITDVRPKLFDGKWKENVGGGDFLLYFDKTGALQYKKELDAQIFANGPNLSKATYKSLSLDGTIESNIEISGARTDDLVRVFLHVRHEAVQATEFSRLAFFQMGGETYNYYATFQNFVFGNAAGTTHNFERTCNAGTNKASTNMYNSKNSGVGVYRESLSGEGPWWFAMGPNTNPVKYSEDTKVVGDRGLIIRSFDARFGGKAVSKPSVSVLCDKLELGVPLGLSKLQKGDYVDMHLEFLVLPRSQDFNTALSNSPNSKSLQYLRSLSTTWERVQEQAARGISVTSISPGGTIRSDYPVRVGMPDIMSVFSDVFHFTVRGKALGFVPVVVCGLNIVDIPPDQGLWARPEGQLTYQLLSDESDARQANYDRKTGKYELVFNVEIHADGYTEFGFGPDPNSSPTGIPTETPTNVPTQVPSLSPTTSSPTTPSPSVSSGHPSSSPTTGAPTGSPTKEPSIAPTRHPTISPTDSPTSAPTRHPTTAPTANPSTETLHPTFVTNLVHVCARPLGTDGEFIPVDRTTEDLIESLKETLGENSTHEIAIEGDAITLDGKLGVLDTRCLVKDLVNPTSYGDPHYRTWSGNSFDFHGGCDLVFLKNPNFHNGMGMEVHLRTKIKTWWSYIESAVLQIGSHTLQLKGGDKSILYWIDGTDGQELLDGEASLGVFAVKFRRINDHQSSVRVDLGKGNAVSLETFKEFVRVNVKAKTPDAFQGSGGLMGSFPTGAMLARDGFTKMADAVAFGKEWQVLISEPMLFHEVDGVQHPQECAMPDDMTTKAKRRRLGESVITEDEAALACSRVEEMSRESCIFDVLATNDKDMAGSY